MREIVILCLAEEDEVRYVAGHDSFLGSQSTGDIADAMRFPDVDAAMPTFRGIQVLDEMFFPGVNPFFAVVDGDQLIGASTALVDPARHVELAEYLGGWGLTIADGDPS